MTIFILDLQILTRNVCNGVFLMTFNFVLSLVIWYPKNWIPYPYLNLFDTDSSNFFRSYCFILFFSMSNSCILGNLWPFSTSAFNPLLVISFCPRSIFCRLGNLWPFSASAFNPSSVILLFEASIVCRLRNLWVFSASAFNPSPVILFFER